jgi:ADP-ribosylglycohydrolase
MTGTFGTLDNRINDSKGCGGVMRAAPAGFFSGDIGHAFTTGAATAAITHGHPSGYWSAGALSAMVHGLLAGADLGAAIEAVRALLADAEGGGETAQALGAAVDLSRRGVPSPDDLEGLGGGWVGEEALAIAVAAALAADDIGVEAALELAVTHGGDSDSTGSVCGNLLGAQHGTKALPSAWIASVEGYDTIRRLAADCAARRRGDFDTGSTVVRARYPSS